MSNTVAVLRDSSSSSEFIYNETHKKWERNAIKNHKLDSLVKQIEDLNNKGSEYRDNARFKDALIVHFNALQLAEEINDTVSIIRVLNSIGTDLRRTSSNIEASEYHYRAFELASYSNKNLKSKAIAMNGLGNIFLELQKPNEAAKYFEKSLAIEIELNSKLGQAINYANFGEVMRMKGDLNSALDFYQKSLEENKSIGSNIGIAICKNAIGSIYLAQQKTTESLKLIREAVSILENSKDAFHKLEMQVSLCKSLISLNQLKESKLLMQQIFETSKSINSYSSQQTAYELQTLLSKKQQEYKTALAAKELAIAYRDSTLTLNNEVKILEIENRYKNKEAVQQIKFLIKEKALIEKTNTNQRRIFILFSLLMSLIVVFTYFMYRSRKRVNLELKKVNQMKSRFFGNVSHEFRTPLTLIKGPLEKLLASKLTKNQKEDAKMMYRNTERLLYLVNQILNLSKIDTGKFKIKAQEANLANELKGISESFEYIAHTKKIAYTVDILNSDNVWYDIEIVEMLLTNMLSNAFKFTPENGQITINGVKEAGNYKLNISNTVDEGVSKNINQFFDRFYTSGSSFQVGTGIGLSLVKELCSMYRAKVSVAQKDKNTIEFQLILPILKEHFNSSEISNEPVFLKKETAILKINSTDETSVDKNSKDEIMLIVEDNEDMRSYIASIFSDSYQIIEAKDGKEGVTLAQNYIPDIIVSDVMMPKVNGIELCNSLKTNSTTNHIPIILLTAASEEEMMLKGLNEMADDYITKPFAIKILKAKIQNLSKVRKTLAAKYREEIVLKPMNQLLKWGNNSFSETLKRVLENEITNPKFGIEEFCTIASMSRTQLHRKLKATTGMSATEFIRVHRVKNASELLKNKDVVISEVCFASGFESTSYFSKQFKIVFGCSPSEYQKKIQNS
ncbi:response regulator [Lutibacter holmesii]|uniref:histidine kinase n=1 Tax=Lutibacter holmesii TaxID=1137985 RepID=A0ABW3WNL6_9FLAO